MANTTVLRTVARKSLRVQVPPSVIPCCESDVRVQVPLSPIRCTMKKKPALRKRKFVVWLRNHTDHDDDETVVIWAKTAEEAAKNVQFNSSRFSIRAVLTAAEARMNWYG
jgi:hypothetical protein